MAFVVWISLFIDLLIADSNLINGEVGKKYSGYNGEGNIIIEGGTLDGNINNYKKCYSKE